MSHNKAVLYYTVIGINKEHTYCFSYGVGIFDVVFDLLSVAMQFLVTHYYDRLYRIC